MDERPDNSEQLMDILLVMEYQRSIYLSLVSTKIIHFFRTAISPPVKTHIHPLFKTIHRAGAGYNYI
ncbi:MAG: hypothetical protein EGP82_06975 [Odoribacter splanchnicus]|nr:hypothetical protein [Odoribacter splanchnicus]